MVQAIIFREFFCTESVTGYEYKGECIIENISIIIETSQVLYSIKRIYADEKYVVH